MTAAQLAQRVQGSVEGPGDVEIRAVAGLHEAGAGDLAFLGNLRYAPWVARTRAGAVLVGRTWQGDRGTASLIRVERPEQAFATLATLFAPPPTRHPAGIHPTAIVGEGAVLGDGVAVGPYAVIGPECRIGARSVIEAHVVLGEHCELGEDCHLHPHVSVRERVAMGHRVVVHNGSVLGSDGYGYTIRTGADGKPSAEKIPQVGRVVIGDDVEIGANVTIDRARFGATRIGNRVKIDNLVQIAHNVVIGDDSGIIAQVGISGSTRIGSGVVVWGQAGLAGHLDIGDGAQVLAQAGVSRDVAPGAIVVGAPAADRREAVKTFALPRTVERLRQRIEALEQAVRTFGDRHENSDKGRERP